MHPEKFRNMSENSTGLYGMFQHGLGDVILKKFNDDLVINVLPVTIFIGVEAVIGFVGNILILCVYSKWYTHCNFRYFVLFLAIYDFTSCVTTLPGEMFSQFHWYRYTYRWICKTKSYFNVFTAWGSAYTLLLLAFDRYRKICRPLAWQIQPSCALKLCASGIFISSFMSFPITILWGTQTYSFVIHGVSLNVSVCEKSGAYANQIYPFIYICCAYILPIGLIMMSTGVLNILIARKLFCKMFIHRLSNNGKERMRRESSESSFSSKNNFVAMGIRKMMNFTTHFMSMKVYNLGLDQNRSDSQNNLTSLYTIALRGMPGEDSENQVDYQRRRPDLNQRTTRTLACNAITTHGYAQQDTNSEVGPLRRKRKTMIMLVLTSVFIATMTVYIALLSLVAKTDNILRTLSNSEKVVFFFFWRLYFINTIINPALYGIMDPRFRAGIKRMFQGRQVS